MQLNLGLRTGRPHQANMDKWRAELRPRGSLSCAAKHPMSLCLLLLPFVCIAVAMPFFAARAAETSSADMQARVAQLRTLLSSDQGTTILDLLGDPRLRQAVLQDADPNTPNRVAAATAGEMMDETLTGIRARLWNLAAELGHMPDELKRVWYRMQLPGSELLRSIGCLVVFLAGGIGAQHLFFRLARPWRVHFDALTLATPRRRASVVCERLLFATLIIAAFAAGAWARSCCSLGRR